MYSCQECDGEDTLRMVSCDVCSRWSHFECAGVDAWIEKVPWMCRFCREEALKKREVEVFEKEKQLEKKLNEIEKKEKEVEDLINEAKEFIESEFEAKQKEMEIVQADLEKKKSDLERKEQELINREKQFLKMKQEGNDKEIGAVGEVEAAGESNSLLEFSKVKEEEFLKWDESFNLGNMMEFYMKINLHEEKDFLKECILRTFDKTFIYKIKFESGSPYHDSRILRVLITTLQKKFKKENYDDKQAKKRIIAAFTQFRNTNNKRNK